MGGLPYEVQVGRFLEARSAEVRALAGDLARWAVHRGGIVSTLLLN